MTTDERRALLIVDVQQGFLAEHTVDLPHRIRGFICAHQDEFELVACSRFVNARDSAYFRQVDQSMTGGPSIELAPSLADLGLPTLDAPTYTSLTPRLLELLHEHEINHVVICGVDTDQCVLATALGALDAGFSTTVLADLCASAAGTDAHEAGMTVLRRALDERNVVPAAMVVAGVEAAGASR